MTEKSPAKDHQKGDSTPAHRNAEPGNYHHKTPRAPRDVEEFVTEQIQGKQNEQELREKFPVDENVWHGYVDVSSTRSELDRRRVSDRSGDRLLMILLSVGEPP